jgi:probable rRNA maturation factor
MEPGSRRIPAAAGILPVSAPPVIVIVADPAWRRLLRNPEAVVRRAARAAGMGAVVVLSSDSEVKRLNARHRGRNKPTNVLTFEPNGHGRPGEIVLALGTVRREAQEARKRPADHLAHLVVHASLHLSGHDHQGAGEARRMEMAEARILGRMGRPNPWKRT